MKSQLQELYENTVVSELQSELGYSNRYQVPRLEKVVINVGIGTYVAKVNSDFSSVVENVEAISSQKAIVRKSKVSVSNFNKLRAGQPNGVLVTLRRRKMYSFLEKLIHVTFPRMRDFKGIRLKSIDKNGNLNIGIDDHTIFPEIVVNDAIKPHGIQITIKTVAKDREASILLLKKLGIPFQSKN